MEIKSFSLLLLIFGVLIANSEGQTNPLNPFSSIFEGMRKLLRRGMEVAKNLKNNIQNQNQNQNTDTSQRRFTPTDSSQADGDDMSPGAQQSSDPNESQFHEIPSIVINKYH